MHASEPPDHAAKPFQTHPTYPTPQGGARSASARPRSSTCTLLVVVEAAGPVAGVIREVMRLRSAVEEDVGDVLHHAHRLAVGHQLCSAGCGKVTG
eukprot:150002-Prymnesium_polylepis.1